MLRAARWPWPVPALGASVLLALLAAVPASRADSLPARAAHVADYDMRVRLDPEAKTLDGQQRIVWRNPSPEPVGELWFHLYLNAFKNSKSTFFAESGGQLRGDRMAEDGWGWVDVRSIRRADGVDLAPGATFEHPDDDNADDRTVWRVPLPEPVPAGRRDRARRGLPGEAAAGLRAHRVLPRLLPRRPVVPQARRLRAGRHARARDRRLELPPVPRELGVLRGLRPLPGRDHAAEALRGRGDRDAHRAPREPGRHVHPRLRAGGRDRLRLDRLAALPGGEVHLLRRRRT